jgi:GH43 family beta-xylosidase
MNQLLLFPVTIFLLAVYCNSKPSDGMERGESEPCVFENPIGAGADPWVFKKDGNYYFSKSQGGAIYVSKSANLTEVLSDLQKVWQQPEQGWNASNLWAPELHFLQGDWYIYYTAGESGPPYIHQRSGVLKAVTDDPLGKYEDKGMLYTGDYIQTGEENTWAIDLTVLDLNDQLYAIWSGWKVNKDDHRTPQHLYIAEMENPWTIKSNRVKISSPEEPWEAGTELAINEGPQILKNKEGEVFIIYSASESWLPSYNLGLLRLKDKKADPMNPDSWVKDGSVFQGKGEVYGVGHASYTTSPDENENWILYHTKVSSEPGWNRVVHMQPFSWNDDGTPDFGTPVQPGEAISKPSGECE